MNKKGMTQIIATVLLVVLIIAMSLIIFKFMARTATLETQKGADKAFAQEICRDNVKIRINNVIYQEGLRINVENLKGQDVVDFIVRLEQDNNVDISKVKYILGGYEETVLVVETDLSPNVVKVIPQIILKKPDIESISEGWWLCSDQMVVYKM